MNIALIIMLPVGIALTSFIALKSVQLGLKWQIQTEQKQEPTLTIPNPIKEHMQAKKDAKQVQYMSEIMDEYLNGPKER